MVALWLVLVGCGSEASAPEPVAVVAPEPVAVVAPEAPPAGRIGGEPILARPAVVGGIAEGDVDAGIDARREAIVACWEAERARDPALAGKLLVRFVIGKDGAVSDARVHSTSLHHDATEACVTAAVREATFAPLSRGDKAIVSYPFVFPPG